MNKGQIFTLDFLIGFSLFIIGIVLFSAHFQQFTIPTPVLSDLHTEALLTSTNLLSLGSPENWNYSNVIIPGVASSYRINGSSWKTLAEMNEIKLKSVFKTKSNIVVFLEDKNDCIVFIENSSLIGANLNTTGECVKRNSINILPKNLVPVTRLAIYNSIPVRMVVYAWK